ncbi:MAG: GNAT family acetyltransferase [Calditrichaeota bacterium]|nr:MAG: GNAT family acetyltransferase [Calditrichota bacterium]
MDFDQIKRTYKNFGVGAVAYNFFYSAINKVTFFKVLVGMTLHPDDVAPQFFEIPPPFNGKILSQEELEMFSQDPENDLSQSFLQYALSKGDQCFGILDNGKLAAYGWYSNKPTRFNDTLDLHFDGSFMYMYRGWTVKAYRGKRLHAIGMANALNHYYQAGYRGLISYVEANNFSSLRSVYRMGYRPFGKIYVVKILNKHFLFYSGKCNEYGFSLNSREKHISRDWGPAVTKP